EHVQTEKAWNGNPVVDVARYQNAMVHLRQRDYAEAIDLLEQIQPSFNGYLISQCQLAFTALLARDKGKEEKATFLGFDVKYPVPPAEADRAALTKRALAALRKLPPLPPNPDPEVAQLYFAARAEEGKLLYTDKKFAELGTFAANL